MKTVILAFTAMLLLGCGESDRRIYAAPWALCVDVVPCPVDFKPDGHNRRPAHVICG